MKKTAVTLALAAALAVIAPAPARAADLSIAPTFDNLALSLQLGATDPDKQPTAQATTVFGLPKNMGPVDRVLRLAIGATLIGVGAYRLSNDMPNDAVSWTLIGVSTIPLATAATGYCPLYQVFGIEESF